MDLSKIYYVHNKDSFNIPKEENNNHIKEVIQDTNNSNMMIDISIPTLSILFLVFLLFVP
jgi:hypothetical protein